MTEEIEYTSKQMRDALKKAYEHIETAKLLTWEAISCGQDDLEWSGQISPEEREIDAQAEYNRGILKITVNDVLPRRKENASSSIPASLLRSYWAGNVAYAVRKLDVAVHYERALCAITVYGPRDVDWDVDNRAISYVINALRMAGIIPGDEWDKLSLLLLGGVDRKNPRTEIRLIEYPEDAINNLFGST